MRSFFWAHVYKLEACVWEGDHTSFYEHVQMMNLEEKRVCSSQLIKDKDGSLLRDLNSGTNDGFVGSIPS